MYFNINSMYYKNGCSVTNFSLHQKLNYIILLCTTLYYVTSCMYV